MPALSAESLQTLAILLSTGVDPFRTIIVQQSRVPELTCPKYYIHVKAVIFRYLLWPQDYFLGHGITV